MRSLAYRALLTVTAKDAVALFALVSLAVQLTRVLPSAKRLPELGVQATGTDASLSS